jgi:RimJ/RimL family protein N-acetyltransferase
MVELGEIREYPLNNSPFTVRAAWPEDAGAIVEYLGDILDDRMASIADRDEMMLDIWSEREHLRRISINPLAISIVAENNREIIGFLTCEGGRRRKIAHVADIGMSVRGDWRRHGVGAALLAYAESWARSTGKISKLTLNVFEENIAAIRLYEGNGFVQEGRLIKQIELDGVFQDLILMAKYL